MENDIIDGEIDTTTNLQRKNAIPQQTQGKNNRANSSFGFPCQKWPSVVFKTIPRWFILGLEATAYV